MLVAPDRRCLSNPLSDSRTRRRRDQREGLVHHRGGRERQAVGVACKAAEERGSRRAQHPEAVRHLIPDRRHPMHCRVVAACAGDRRAQRGDPDLEHGVRQSAPASRSARQDADSHRSALSYPVCVSIYVVSGADPVDHDGARALYDRLSAVSEPPSRTCAGQRPYLPSCWHALRDVWS